MEDPSNDHEEHPIQRKNNQKLYNEKELSPLSLKETQQKPRLKYDQNFPIDGEPL